MKKSLIIGLIVYLSIGACLGVFYGKNDVYCAEPIDPGYYMTSNDEPNPAHLVHSACLESLPKQKVIRGLIVTFTWPLYFVYRYLVLAIPYPWILIAPGLRK